MSSKDYKIFLVLVIFSLLIQIVTFVYSYNEVIPYDDAYITYRYAKNLSENLGWVYNINELTSGTTTFTNTIIIAFLRIITGIDIEIIARVLPLIFSLFSTILISLIILNKLSSYIISGLISIIYSLLPKIHTMILSGMETSLFIFAILFTTYLLMKKKYFAAALIGSTLIYIRADGIIFSILIITYFLYNIKIINIKKVIFYISLIIVINLSYFFINYYFFGIYIPLSMHAKRIIYTDTVVIQDRISVLKGLIGRKGVLLVPFIFVAIIKAINKRDNEILLLSLYLFGYILFYIVVNPWMRPWYNLVPLTFMFILFIYGLYNLYILIKNNNTYLNKLGKVFIVITIFSFTVYSIYSFYKNYPFGNRIIDRFNTEIIRVTDYLMKDENIKQKSIFVGDIGLIGFKTQARIIDYSALVYPKALKFSKYKRNYNSGIAIDYKKQLEFIEDEKPDYVIYDNVYLFYQAIKKEEKNYLKENYFLVRSGGMDIWKKKF